VNQRKEIKMKREGKWFTSIGILLIILFVGFTYHIDAKNNSSNKSPQWTAPPEASKLKNPVKDSKENVDEGRKIYVQQCATCHGQTGKGNGPAGKYLPKKPANFTKADFQKQTDGEIFWKISEGILQCQVIKRY